MSNDEKKAIQAAKDMAGTPANTASKRMLDAAGVRYYKYNRTGRDIRFEV